MFLLYHLNRLRLHRPLNNQNHPSRRFSPKSAVPASSVGVPKSGLNIPRKRAIVEFEEPLASRAVSSSSSFEPPVFKTVDSKPKVEAKAPIIRAVTPKLTGPASLVPEPKGGPKVTLQPRAAVQECWVSIDFNVCLNVSRAGDQEGLGIHPVENGVRVGVTSYIGVSGFRSKNAEIPC